MELGQRDLEERSRALFHQSVDGIDLGVRSRLTQARHAALDAARRPGPRAWLSRIPLWTPAVGMTAAALLATALWFGTPLGRHVADSTSADIDIVTGPPPNVSFGSTLPAVPPVEPLMVIASSVATITVVGVLVGVLVMVGVNVAVLVGVLVAVLVAVLVEVGVGTQTVIVTVAAEQLLGSVVSQIS